MQERNRVHGRGLVMAALPIGWFLREKVPGNLVVRCKPELPIVILKCSRGHSGTQALSQEAHAITSCGGKQCWVGQQDQAFRCRVLIRADKMLQGNRQHLNQCPRITASRPRLEVPVSSVR